MNKSRVIKGGLIGLCSAGLLLILGNYVSSIQNSSDNFFLKIFDWVVYFLGSPPAMMAITVAGSIFNGLYGTLLYLFHFSYFLIIGVLLMVILGRNNKRDLALFIG